MKKQSLYIFFTFIILFLFNIELNALTCTYQNPYDINGEDIVIEFSAKNDKTGKVADKEVTTCIDGSKSSFFGESFDLHFWNPNKNNLGLYDKDSFFTFSYKSGTYWTFYNGYNQFVGKDCTENVFGYSNTAGKELTCPSLTIIPTMINSSSTVKLVNVISLTATLPGNTGYTPLVLKKGSSQIVDNEGNITEEKNIFNTCNYTIDVSRMHGNGNTFTDTSTLEVQGWSDGTTKFIFDSTEVKLDLSKKYPFDAYTNKRQAYFLMDSNNINTISTKGNANEGYKLDCMNTGYVYYDKNLKSSNGHKGVYVITFSKSDIPNDAEYIMFGKYADESPDYGQLQGGNVSNTIGTCESYLGLATEEGKIAHYLDQIYTIIKIVSILITIVWSMLDLTKVIVHNKDELMDAVKKDATRLIILILILLLPTFIDLLGKLAGHDNILCGIK